MANIKVNVEVEIPKNFKPCENNRQIYDQYECPFSYYHYDNSCQTCDKQLSANPLACMWVKRNV